MQSVEYKCELRDPVLAQAVCKRLGGVRAAICRQVDTYFRVPDGRLKRREVSSEAGEEPVEWFFYHRENRAQPKICRFTIYSEAQARARFGQAPPPLWVVVRKRRTIWVLGGVRVLVDEVDELGWFLEVQALVSPAQHVGVCHREIRRLLAALKPALGESIACSYADLLAQERAQTST